MNIPNFIECKVVDENGFLTNEFRRILSQLITQLQINLSDEGYILPSKSTSDIEKMNNVNSSNLLVVDKDSNQLKINLNGTFKVVQVI